MSRRQLDAVHTPLGRVLGTRQLSRPLSVYGHQKLGVRGQIMRGLGVAEHCALAPVGLTEKVGQPENEDDDHCAQ